MGPEQLIPAAVAKTADAALEEGKGLIRELLGPLFRSMGADLDAWYQGCQMERRANAQKIMNKASETLGDRMHEPGMIHPKILFGALENGSWSNEELSAAYYGGILASSRTNFPRDDRGAAFLELLKGLSSYDMRFHFIVYRAIYELLSGWKLNMGLYAERKQMRVYLPEEGVRTAMAFETGEDGAVILSHSLSSLVAKGLLEEVYAMGSCETLREIWSDAPEGDGLVLGPSALGAELFLWVHGDGGMPVQVLTHPHLTLPLEPSIPEVPGASRTVIDALRIPWFTDEAIMDIGPKPSPASPTDSETAP